MSTLPATRRVWRWTVAAVALVVIVVATWTEVLRALTAT